MFTGIRFVAIATLGGLLFPAGAAFAQEKEDKDALIKMLKEQLERQQKESEAVQKALLETQRQNQALLKNAAELQKILARNQEELLLKLKIVQVQAEARAKEGQEKFDRLEAQLIQARIQTKRQNDQVAVLEKTIADREALIVKLEADLKALKLKGNDFDKAAATRQNEILRAQVRDLALQLAVLKGQPRSVDATKLNPPAVTVNGQIERVDDKESSLVQITLGTDHGLRKNDTLDVYRAKPEPTYIGTVRIIEAYHQKSVGQMLHKEARVRQNDLVTSKLPDDVRGRPKVFELRDPNEQNPPNVTVDGRIEKVDPKDASLVTISLGADHGLKEGHTLIVYRTKPEPKYLGMIRIMSVKNTSSVGQLVIQGNSAYRPMLREGDFVTSKLTR